MGKDQVKKRKYPVMGFITAFVSELTNITIQFDEEYPVVEIAGRRFFSGIYEGLYLVAVVSGIGISNSSMTTQLMIDKFNPKYLVFYGIAGLVNTNRQIGTILAPQRVAEYRYQKTIGSKLDKKGRPLDSFQDFSIDFPNKFFRIKKNKVLSFDRPNCNFCCNKDQTADNIIKNSQVTTKGMDIPMYLEAFTEGGDAFLENRPQKFFFYADKFLLSLVEKLIDQGVVLPAQICPEGEECYTPPVIIGDLIGSASTFLDNAQERDILYHSYLEGNIVFEAVDMESASFAHVCYSNKKPFMVLRNLSDLASGNSLVQITQFLQIILYNGLYYN